MRLKSDRPLLVVANPFCTRLDKMGRPCGVVQYDPEHTGKNSVRWIGARYTNTMLEPRPKFGGQQTRYDRRAIFDLTVQRIVDSQYHRERIAAGVLIPADADTAARAKAEFVDPAKALENSMRNKVAAWAEQHGEEPSKDGWGDMLLNWPKEKAK